MLKRPAQPRVGPAGVFVDCRRNDGLLALAEQVEHALAVDAERPRHNGRACSIEQGAALAARLLNKRYIRQCRLDRRDDFVLIGVDVDRDDVVESERYADSSVGPLGPDLGLNVGRQALAEPSPVGFVEPFAAAVDARNLRPRPAWDGAEYPGRLISARLGRRGTRSLVPPI